MRSRSRRFTRRFRRAKREYIWVRNWTQGSLLRNGDLGEIAVVSGTDWVRQGIGGNASIEKGCVLVRQTVQGCINWGVDDSPGYATAEASGFVTMRRVDADDNATINAAVDLFQEDWMHVEYWNVQAAYAVVATLTWADTAQRFQRFGWDSKLKRKLTSEDEIRIGFAVAGIAGGGVTAPFFETFTQSLLQLP